MTIATKATAQAPKVIARLACTWCGAPSGRPGVTLKKVTQVVSGGYRELVLCPNCQNEHAQFGRKLSYREWRAVFWQIWKHNLRQTLRTLRQLLSIRQWMRESRIQYRFRFKDEKIRA